MTEEEAKVALVSLQGQLEHWRALQAKVCEERSRLNNQLRACIAQVQKIKQLQAELKKR